METAAETAERVLSANHPLTRQLRETVEGMQAAHFGK
jgi:hypothetical protein